MEGRVRRIAVASFASRPLAELARGYLEEHGVDATVAADDGNGTQPEVGFVTGGAWLVVQDVDLDRARGLLAVVDGGAAVAPGVPARSQRLVAGFVAGTMVLIGVWTVLVVLLR